MSPGPDAAHGHAPTAADQPGDGEEPIDSDREEQTDSETPTDLARELLVACKTDAATGPFERALSGLEDSALAPVREKRERALAFWINCYNAATQLLLARRPDRYESRLRSVRFFLTPALTVAGTGLSLDRIENGLLRSGRSKYALGYLPKVLVTRFERRHALGRCDPRVHFALNCGAASCPAIRAYDPERVDAQLDRATRTYLAETVSYDPAGGVARVPRVMLWFRGDFGGGSGIRRFLCEFDALPADAVPTIRYRDWDWSPALGKFVDR
jgi:hypothetical protein